MQNVLYLYLSPFSFCIYSSIIYYTTTAVSSSPSCPTCPSPIPPFFAISTSPFLSEKGKSQKYQPAMAQQVNDKTRHIPHNKTGQFSRRKRNPKSDKRSVTDPRAHCKNSHRNTKIHSHNIYSENLSQTHTGFLIFVPVFRNLYKPWLVHSVGHFLVASSPLLVPTILCSRLQQDSQNSA